MRSWRSTASRPAYANASLRLALAMVVEERSGALVVLVAPIIRRGAAPDFHHADAFVLRVEAARRGAVLVVGGAVKLGIDRLLAEARAPGKPLGGPARRAAGPPGRRLDA